MGYTVLLHVKHSTCLTDSGFQLSYNRYIKEEKNHAASSMKNCAVMLYALVLVFLQKVPSLFVYSEASDLAVKISASQH